MCFLRLFLIVEMLSGSFLLGQSIFNAYGLGLTRGGEHVSSQGIGGIGLVPVFRKGVSLDNPSTWHRLRFTTLNSAIIGRKINVEPGISNGSNALNQLQFIVPIARKFAWGISLAPLTEQRTFMQTDSSLLVFEGDSIFTQKEARSGGGIAAFSTAISLPFSDKVQLGLKFDILFGSSRDNYVLKVNESEFRTYQHKIYKGMLIHGFINSEILKRDRFSVQVYGGIGGTFIPVSADIIKIQPFGDTNRNFYYDESDYPDSLMEETSVLRYVYMPKYFSAGVNVDFQNGFNIIGEIQQWQDDALNGSTISIFPDFVEKKQHFTLGFAKFINQRPREWYERLYYRGGMYYTSHTLRVSKKSINERGFSLGIGLNFGATGNQIDLAYKTGDRSIVGGQNESFEEISIGISLGDLWFLKRRAR